MPSGPKNQKYTNRHAEEARLRDQERETTRKNASAKAKEDAMWADDGNSKKLSREREEAQRAAEKAKREAEKRQQLESEDAEFTKKAQPTKVTKKQMQREVAKLVKSYDSEVANVRSTGASAFEEKPAPLPQGNLNKQQENGKRNQSSVETISGSGIDGSLNAMTASTATVPENRHIGKRSKVLYKRFVTENEPKLKEEHPGLKRTQYNNMLWDLWAKSPQNPFVLRAEARAMEAMEQERTWMQGESGDDEDEDEA